MSTAVRNGEYGVFTHLAEDPFGDASSSRPFVRFQPLCYRTIRICVRMELEPDETAMKASSNSWLATISARSLCHGCNSDGLYVVGARLTDVAMYNVISSAMLGVSLVGASGMKLPFEVQTASAWRAPVSASAAGSCPLSAHFILTPSVHQTPVVAISKSMRSLVGIARAETHLTRFILDLNEEEEKVGSVRFAGTAGHFVDNAMTRAKKQRVLAPIPAHLSAFAKTPSDWYPFVAANFVNAVSASQKSHVDVSFSNDAWKKGEGDANLELGMDNLGGGVCGPSSSSALIDTRSSNDTALTVHVNADCTDGRSRLPSRLPGFPPELSMILEVFVVVFPTSSNV